MKSTTNNILDTSYYIENKDTLSIEIGIDEAGRGPMFGRVYAAAVVLPKDNTFKHEWMKDSKKFHSEKKINDVANYIKENSIVWSVCYLDEDVIDSINIRQATLKAMHMCVKDIISKLPENHTISLILVDGNDFKPYLLYDKKNNLYNQISHVCIEGGDNKYTSIAAASILAKVERDLYIKDMCEQHPELKDKYQIHKNKGYGTKYHMDGIRKHGITKWHRKTYGICRDYTNSSISIVNEDM